MPVGVVVTKDFDHMSAVAADLVTKTFARVQQAKRESVLGLATGNTPTGLYKLLAKAANAGEFDSAHVRSFNLDEYIGLPGDNAQQRVLHPESYAYFMIQEFFSLLAKTFRETRVPYGALVEQERFEFELERHPDDWAAEGRGAGTSIVIKPSARSEYLAWIRREIQQGYEEKIASAGGIDIQVIGVGGNGHVGFHEAGIPFEGSRVLVVKLDHDTIRNAVADGHFETERDPVARSLLEGASTDIPISYGQKYAKNGGNLVCVVDVIAGADLLGSRARLAAKGIELEDLRA